MRERRGRHLEGSRLNRDRKGWGREEGERRERREGKQMERGTKIAHGKIAGLYRKETGRRELKSSP